MMVSRHSPWPGQSVLPVVGQGCVAPPSDRGSGSPPWTYLYPSGRGWSPVRTRTNTTVPVWRTLRGGLPIPWTATDTPRSPLLPPLLIYGSPPWGTGGQLWWSPLPRCDLSAQYHLEPVYCCWLRNCLIIIHRHLWWHCLCPIILFDIYPINCRCLKGKYFILSAVAIYNGIIY